VVTKISETHAPDADYEAARQQFSKEEFADLTLAIGLTDVYNRTTISFRKTPQPLLAKGGRIAGPYRLKDFLSRGALVANLAPLAGRGRMASKMTSG
jgi:hypothetical protein